MEETTKIITATEFKTNLGKYLDYVIDNHTLIVSKNGKKAVRLIPYAYDFERSDIIKEQTPTYQYKGKKMSYEDFTKIYEESDLRMEYINGEIVPLTSPSTLHQEVSGNLYVLLRNFLRAHQLETCKVFYAPFDVHFFKKGSNTPDVMQPDLLVACDIEPSINDNDRYMGTPNLCIEILSDSTRSKDMVDKLTTYMLSGVNEYWIVDPKKPLILVYGFKSYEVDEYKTYQLEDTLVSYSFENLTINLKDIFD